MPLVIKKQYDSEQAYRDNLEQILAFTDGKHTLTATEVSKYTGMDWETVKRHYTFRNGRISAVTLARLMC